MGDVRVVVRPVVIYAGRCEVSPDNIRAIRSGKMRNDSRWIGSVEKSKHVPDENGIPPFNKGIHNPSSSSSNHTRILYPTSQTPVVTEIRLTQFISF